MNEDTGEPGMNIRSFSLSQNYPNPFNAATTIRYHLLKPAKVKIKIYNLQGKIVRNLISRDSGPTGFQYAGWDGTDNRGVNVSSGVYLYQLTANGLSKTKKMLLLQ